MGARKSGYGTLRPPQIQMLERRCLLAAAPAELLMQSNYPGVKMDESVVAGGTLYMTGHRNSDVEHLYAANNGVADDLFASTTFFGTENVGITALTNYRDRFYFFANGSAGDGLFTSDGTAGGTK